MQTYHVYVSRISDQAAMANELRRVLPTSNLALVGWYDRTRHTGGPLEACAGQPEECVRTYALSHGAAYEVSVNDDQLELFYAATPPDTAELDWRELVDIHRGAERDDRFDDLQGG